MLNIEIKKLTQQEVVQFIDLIRLFEDVFEMKNFSIPDKDYLQMLLEEDNFLVFVAVSESKVVGGLTSYVLRQYYSRGPLAYVYDLAVATAFQRQGIGR